MAKQTYKERKVKQDAILKHVEAIASNCKTGKEVAAKLGVNLACAQNLLRQAAKLRETEGKWFCGLSNSAAWATRKAGYTSKESIYEDVRSGKLKLITYSQTNTAGIGRAHFIEICEWLNINPDEYLEMYINEKEKKQIKAAISLLTNRGYTITK